MHVALFVRFLFSSETCFFPLLIAVLILSLPFHVVFFLFCLPFFYPSFPILPQCEAGSRAPDLLSFCLYSPRSLKSSFIPPCSPIVLCLTLLVLKCSCPCLDTCANSVVQVHASACICSNCYLEFAVRGRLSDSWKDRFGEGERGLFDARTAC